MDEAKLRWIDEAIGNISPLADHLRDWMISESASHPSIEREWIYGVLKETIAEQNPDIPMTTLDFYLPCPYIDDDINEEDI